MSTAPRQCLWLDETHESPDRPGYFIPNLVTENEPGYCPLSGNPENFQHPWLFGPGIEEAKRQVDESNARFGLSHADALTIVLSSMGAGDPR